MNAIRTSVRKFTATLLLTVTLAITPKSYHVTYTGHADEVHVVIKSADGTVPYIDIEAVPLGADVVSIDFLRHNLPTGSYVISAETWVWQNNELVWAESSDTIIIHIPKK